MTAKDFIEASNDAVDLRGQQKESFVNFFIGMLQAGVRNRSKQSTEDLTRMVKESVKYAKSQKA